MVIKKSQSEMLYVCLYFFYLTINFFQNTLCSEVRAPLPPALQMTGGPGLVMTTTIMKKPRILRTFMMNFKCQL